MCFLVFSYCSWNTFFVLVYIGLIEFCQIIHQSISLSLTADTPLAEVKLGELPAWLKRRQIGLSPAAGAVSRG